MMCGSDYEKQGVNRFEIKSLYWESTKVVGFVDVEKLKVVEY